MNTHPHALTVRLRFEAAHRLPQLGGKCTNLHGHSWQAHITLGAHALDHDTILADFGLVKGLLQDYADIHLDHAALQGNDDPLTPVLSEHGKVYAFGADPHTRGLSWPTVEAVAEMLARLTETLMEDQAPQLHLELVEVSETENNTAQARR